jgi:hypothetical protein
MRKNIFLVLFSLLGLLFPESGRGQDLGNVGLRTVQSVLATNVACTGSPQLFATSSPALNALGFRNLGQTQHLASATSAASTFTMEIDGIDALGNTYRISDVQIGIPISAQTGIVVQGSGTFPIVQVNVTCTAAATFSLSYSGGFSTPITNLGAALLNTLDKVPFQTAPANANKTITFQTPYANSAGTILFQYSAAGPTGSTITVQCISNAGGNLALFTFSPTTVATLQLFTVTATTCPFVSLTYTSGGASAVTYTLEYVFNSPGTVNSVLGGGNVQGTVAAGVAVGAQNPLDVGGVEIVSNNAIPITAYQPSSASTHGNGIAIGKANIAPTATLSEMTEPNGNSAMAVEMMGMINNSSTLTGVDLSTGVCATNAQCPGVYTRKAGYSKLQTNTAGASGTIGLWQGVNSTGIFTSCRVDLQVTAVSGTAPTLDVFLQDSPDNTTFTDRIHFAQVTATGNFFAAIATAAGITPTAFTNKTLAAATKVDGPISGYGQIAYVIAGTGPSFTFTVTTTCD